MMGAIFQDPGANTDPQRDSIFIKGQADVLDHATSKIAIGSKLGIDAARRLSACLRPGTAGQFKVDLVLTGNGKGSNTVSVTPGS